ncbi:hypothetical protein [Psychromarinibacter halotolerans]|uniref:Secreted protein n=1 Tax=Psychromarinibacter halotolerans TaxID=1775175 RepID=A0ABV7GRY3_9RHOB|nr:hypothetical protein [Psychromarinibacter halotolerans]MDF0595215.1 hypothetical protein [Psychromarinibacter halotolerans]
MAIGLVLGVHASGSASAAPCDEIAILSMESRAPLPTDTGSDLVVCEWRTVDDWAPPQACGNQGFEVVGWGSVPSGVTFKRLNTAYESNWTPIQTDGNDPDQPEWSSETLLKDSVANRCFAGWCEPKTYRLRTVEPVPEGVCAQRVELRVRMTAEKE